MKIAILSMQKVYNYGSVLQAYSLQYLLEQITKKKVDFIDIDTSNLIDINMPIKDNMDYGDANGIKKNCMYYYRKTINYLKKKTFRKEIKKFQNEFLRLAEENNQKQYDLVVIGSDEVFKATDNINLQLYGEVPNSEKVITYAASCGSADYEGIPEEKCEVVKKAMNNIVSMSVRDQHTYEYVSKLYDGDICFNLDPVLMGPLAARKHEPVNMSKYMVVYAYGDRIRKKEEIEAITKFAKERKLQIIALGEPQFWCDKYIPVSPFRVLDYFYYAEYVVTDTFHGSIFSIINGCKFATLLRVTNQNKLGDLLERLGLQDRVINKVDDLSAILDKKIDYDSVKLLLEEEKRKTMNYLRMNASE